MTRFAPLLASPPSEAPGLVRLHSQPVIDALTPNGRASGTIDLHNPALTGIAIRINADIPTFPHRRNP